ncbi:methyl-accepting chemotaxis protein [Thiomicrorhabdus sp.]|uniref:methyl-accepting chemotaxis protein n=1 Tax=Thiomicrorhabdus sp. TaxID=2039724 RepID=UPI00356B025D
MIKTVKTKLTLSNAVIIIGVSLLIAYGLYGLSKMQQELDTLYQDRIQPLQQMWNINQLSIENYRYLPEAYLENPANKAEILDQINSNRSSLTHLWESYNATYITEEERKLADQLYITAVSMDSASQKIAKLISENKTDYLKTHFETLSSPTLQKTFVEKMNKVISIQVNISEQINQEAERHLQKTMSTQLIAIALLIVIVLTATILTTRSILADLGAEPHIVKGNLKRLSEGDFTETPDPNSFPEQSVMHSLSKMIAELHRAIKEANNTAFSTAGAAEELSSVAQEISASQSQQSISIEQSSASLQNIKDFITNTSNTVQELRNQVEQSNIEIKSRVKHVQDMIDKTQLITKKIGIMDDISYQTNLLAVNAAIEAGRAGENGRAFAVVASEIRKLANKNQQSAEEIHELSTEVMDLSQNAQTSLKNLTDSIDAIAQQMENITIANIEQTRSVRDINDGVMNIADAISASASATEELAATSEELAAQSSQLKVVMTFFKLQKTENQAQKPVRADLLPDIKVSEKDFENF